MIGVLVGALVGVLASLAGVVVGALLSRRGGEVEREGLRGRISVGPVEEQL